jgi:hypothetical protein
MSCYHAESANCHHADAQTISITVMLRPNFRQNACIALAKCPIIMLMPITMLQTSAHHAENEADVSM